MKKSDAAIPLAIGMMLATAAAAQHAHEGDLWIGRSASDRLKLDLVCGPDCGFDPDHSATVLLPDEFGGFSSDSPGFDRLTADQPAGEDLYMLAAGAQVWLRIDSDVPDPGLADLKISPALFIYDPLSFTFFPYEDGGTLYREVYLGNHLLHKHVVWFLDPGDPGYDPDQCVWELTARLVDKGSTSYSPSEPFTLRFSLHPLVPGDFDCDGDVDGGDLALFEACQSGPAIQLGQGCERFDLDGDHDADAADFAVIQRSWTGPGPGTG